MKRCRRSKLCAHGFPGKVDTGGVHTCSVFTSLDYDKNLQNAGFPRHSTLKIYHRFFQVKLFPDPCMCALWRAFQSIHLDSSIQLRCQSSSEIGYHLSGNKSPKRFRSKRVFRSANLMWAKDSAVSSVFDCKNLTLESEGLDLWS